MEVNSNNNWWHLGSLPGTTTEIVRASNQLNWAILFNTRPANPDPLASAADNLVWSVLPKIISWPANDLFTSAGIDEIPDLSGLNIFPNPTHGKISITFSSNDNKVVNLKIFNSTGKLVLSQPILNNIKTLSLDLSQCPEGAYLVIATTDRQTTFERKILLVK